MPQRVTREALESLARQAVAACGGEKLVATALDGFRPTGRIAVAGAGKAVRAMAEGARLALGEKALFGPLVGKYPEATTLPLLLAGHPLPDQRSVAATDALLKFIATLDESDELILLLSGGASALIGGPLDGVSLDLLLESTDRLLRRGAPIHAINTVRRHLCRALGGRLALATRAKIHALVLSDVIGDEPWTIASGPVSADPSTFADAFAVAETYALPHEVIALFSRGARGEIADTPKRGDPRLERVRYQILASPSTLRAKAVAIADANGFATVIDEQLVSGDVEELVASYRALGAKMPRGEVRISVGEPTVHVRGSGRGGRCQQFSLAMANAFAGENFLFLAMGSDGSDGPTDAAGAVVDGASFAAATALGLDPARALTDCDAYPLLESLDALIRTGATGTNLLDLYLFALL